MDWVGGYRRQFVCYRRLLPRLPLSHLLRGAAYHFNSKVFLHTVPNPLELHPHFQHPFTLSLLGTSPPHSPKMAHVPGKAHKSEKSNLAPVETNNLDSTEIISIKREWQPESRIDGSPRGLALPMPNAELSTYAMQLANFLPRSNPPIHRLKATPAATELGTVRPSAKAAHPAPDAAATPAAKRRKVAHTPHQTKHKKKQKDKSINFTRRRLELEGELEANPHDAPPAAQLAMLEAEPNPRHAAVFDKFMSIDEMLTTAVSEVKRFEKTVTDSMSRLKKALAELRKESATAQEIHQLKSTIADLNTIVTKMSKIT
jgi:hypothetical protein